MKEGILCWNWDWWRGGLHEEIFIDALGEFICTQAITKEYDSSREIYQQIQTAVMTCDLEGWSAPFCFARGGCQQVFYTGW